MAISASLLDFYGTGKANVRWVKEIRAPTWPMGCRLGGHLKSYLPVSGIGQACLMSRALGVGEAAGDIHIRAGFQKSTVESWRSNTRIPRVEGSHRRCLRPAWMPLWFRNDDLTLKYGGVQDEHKWIWQSQRNYSFKFRSASQKPRFIILTSSTTTYGSWFPSTLSLSLDFDGPSDPDGIVGTIAASRTARWMTSARFLLTTSGGTSKVSSCH